ncbi:MAG: hypothetical protein SH850_00450 [Planctomycetaceae bacterium]|nr:hypothetical protein [Planctomycetaceae bacterium]
MDCRRYSAGLRRSAEQLDRQPPRFFRQAHDWRGLAIVHDQNLPRRRFHDAAPIGLDEGFHTLTHVVERNVAIANEPHQIDQVPLGVHAEVQRPLTGLSSLGSRL